MELKKQEKFPSDFDTLNQGDEGTCVFTFKNTGDAQLIVSDVATSCGCTAASFDDHPVMPQRTGKIEVSYDTSNWGYFTKYIKDRLPQQGRHRSASL